MKREVKDLKERENRWHEERVEMKWQMEELERRIRE